MSAIKAIIDRDDPRIARRAISLLHIDLAAEWPRLSDDQRDWLVDAGIVSVIEADVTCTHAAPWAACWDEDVAAAWPSYTLRISAPGMAPIGVDGWHLVGILPPDAEHRRRGWRRRNDDGAYGGLPRIRGWDIRGGENCDGGGLIPCWRQGDRWVTLDRCALRWAIAEAAETADHGAEPTWQDVRVEDMRCVASRYVIRDATVAEIDILHGGLAPCDDGTYWAEAWAVEGRPETYPSLNAAVAAVAAMADDNQAYSTEAEATAALGRMVEDTHGSPPGLVVGHDDDGLFVVAEDGDDKYHLDGPQLTAVLRHGWSAVTDDIADAFGDAGGC
jgi:hypothetical protein